jgi:hypothetical protein
MKSQKTKHLLDGDGNGTPTQGEYYNGLHALIMGDEEYPAYGYKGVDLRKRIEKLLDIEEQCGRAGRPRRTCRKCGIPVSKNEGGWCYKCWEGRT